MTRSRLMEDPIAIGGCGHQLCDARAIWWGARRWRQAVMSRSAAVPVPVPGTWARCGALRPRARSAAQRAVAGAGRPDGGRAPPPPARRAGGAAAAAARRRRPRLGCRSSAAGWSGATAAAAPAAAAVRPDGCRRSSYRMNLTGERSRTSSIAYLMRRGHHGRCRERGRCCCGRERC